MKRSSSSQFAILGMLTLGAMTGYELRQTIAGSIANFWSESYGQIYPALKALEKQGWAVSKQKNKQARLSGGRERITYSITAKGRAALRAWLHEPAQRQQPRNETLLKLFFAAEAGPQAIADLLQSAHFRAEQESARFAAIRKSLVKEHAGHPQLPFWLATLSAGEHYNRATVAWAKQTRRELEKAGVIALRRKRARA